MPQTASSILAKIQATTKKHSCDCCGSNNWQPVIEENGHYPALVMVPSDGSFALPPPHLRVALLICGGCTAVRVHFVPPEQPKP